MYTHILAATDFSQLGDRALQKAASLAVELEADLTFVHVMVSEDSANPMYAQHEVRAHVEKLEASKAKAREALSERAKRAGHIKIEFEVRVGEPAAEILAAAEQRNADLVVVSSNGQRGFTRWLLGSTTDRVVRGVTVDVLVVT
jgi:nucleotide-binding universal stress UspA family protein